jgi:RNA polymerase sigma factor (sigma-70 family)
MKERSLFCEYMFVLNPSEQLTRPDGPDATRSSLVKRLRNWDDQCGWQVFFDRYWKLIYAVAVKAGLSDAEAQDLVQETVVSVAKQMREGGYDRAKGSFKSWLCMITRRRIVDYFRRRTKVQKQPLFSADDTHSTVALVADPASPELEEVWEEEWRKNLMSLAIDRVKEQVAPKHFQIFDLTAIKGLPTREVTNLLKVSAAQVYMARHRVGMLVKKEVRRLEAQAQKVASNG